MTKQISFFLIDDDVDDVQLFADVLREVDTSVTLYTAKDGLDALEKLAELPLLPHIVFLDLNMPRMDGKECLRQLKSDARFKNLPIVMYTTSTQAKDIEETMMAGASCFITKPSSMKELKHILASIAASLPNNLSRGFKSLGDLQSSFVVCQ